MPRELSASNGLANRQANLISGVYLRCVVVAGVLSVGCVRDGAVYIEIRDHEIFHPMHNQGGSGGAAIRLAREEGVPPNINSA